jgi:hypothetical protein
MSGPVSGRVSGNQIDPTCASAVPTITWTLYVGNVGFSQQERGRENLRHFWLCGGLE